MKSLNDRFSYRIKIRRPALIIMALGFPIIASFQNCGPNKMDFDLDKPGLVIESPTDSRPTDPNLVLPVDPSVTVDISAPVDAQAPAEVPTVDSESHLSEDDNVDLNDGLPPAEVASDDTSEEPTTSADDVRSSEQMNFICRVKVGNNVRTVKFKDGEFNSKKAHHKNRPFVACMSKFSCENLIGGKYEVIKAAEKKLCSHSTKKRVIHLTRDDVIRYLKN